MKKSGLLCTQYHKKVFIAPLNCPSSIGHQDVLGVAEHAALADWPISPVNILSREFTDSHHGVGLRPSNSLSPRAAHCASHTVQN